MNIESTTYSLRSDSWGGATIKNKNTGRVSHELTRNLPSVAELAAMPEARFDRVMAEFC